MLLNIIIIFNNYLCRFAIWTSELLSQKTDPSLSWNFQIKIIFANKIRKSLPFGPNNALGTEHGTNRNASHGQEPDGNQSRIKLGLVWDRIHSPTNIIKTIVPRGKCAQFGKTKIYYKIKKNIFQTWSKIYI